ncbi:MAG: PHP domain-containing protein, partial [Desulfobacterales bacterium]
SLPYSGSIHILGYSINLDDPILNHTLKVLQEARKNRNPQILERLNNIGIDITFNDILKEAGDGQVGRPHIAQSMVNKGFVKSIDEAFNNYLGQGKPAYVDKFRVDCSKAIKIILDSGGFPVLAHPVLLKTKNDDILENLVVTLKTMGLKGIEVYYPEHSPDNIAYYTKLAKRYDLLMTGGTDFHGSLKPDLKIGSGNGDFFVPYELYEKLVKSR